MGGLFSGITNLIRTRIFSVFVRLRQWLNPAYASGRIRAAFNTLFTKIFNVKPRDQKDYYNIAKWQVSKKLAYMLVVLIMILGGVYLYGLSSSYRASLKDPGYKIYKYNNVLLRFCQDTVGITGKSGYLAYVGEVRKGACNGNGTLYRPDGSTVYEGGFASSMYEGLGRSYYPNGNTEYIGNFHENLFSGNGRLFRENSSLVYDGEFAKGLKDGKGTLYDSGSNMVYTGTFSNDHLVYSELLGKDTSKIAEKYVGRSDIYESDDEFLVHMKDIDAMYLGELNEDTVEDSITTDVIYVLSDEFYLGDKKATNIAELNQIFDKLAFEGNAYINMGEAVSINTLYERGKNIFNAPVNINSNPLYDDYTEVKSFDDNTQVYLYGYEYNGMVYTFVCEDKNKGFEFYYIRLSDG